MKEQSNKKEWKYNRIVKDLHTPKYRQRVKKSKQKYVSNKESIQEGLEEYLKEEKGTTP